MKPQPTIVRWRLRTLNFFAWSILLALGGSCTGLSVYILAKTWRAALQALHTLLS